MSTFSRLVVISLLCLLISLSTSSFVAAGRHIGVVNKKEGETQDITAQSLPKSRDQTLPIAKQNKNIIPSQEVAINGTLLNDVKKTKVKVEEKTRQVSKNTRNNNNNNNAQESSEIVLNRHEREDHKGKLPDHAKQMKSNKFRQTTVTWRVPRKKKDVPDTGFFLDYAPPKVHPPSHN